MTDFIIDVDKDEDTVEVAVEVEHYRPYQEAYITGLPEDCYPEEPAEVDYLLYYLDGSSAEGMREYVDEDVIIDKMEEYYNEV